MSSIDVRDIFGDRAKKDDVLSAGGTSKREGMHYSKLIYPQHKEDKIDKITKEYGQGTGYAEWQKKTYPVKVSYKNEILRKQAEERKRFFG